MTDHALGPGEKSRARVRRKEGKGGLSLLCLLPSLYCGEIEAMILEGLQAPP